ncbi:MAG: ATP-binding cassette domain-containing protein, partial [Eubacterium sp.]
AIKNGIQVIYQDFSIFPNLSVAENIALNTLRTQKKKTVKWNTLRKIAQAALDNIGVKMDLYEKVEKLSVADKQLVAICRAINQDAKLIVLDEPTTALTKREVERLLDIIRELKSRGIAIIFVTHKLDEVIEVSDTVSIVRNGENVIDGPISEFDMTKFSYYMTGKEIVDVQFDQQLKDGKSF